MRVYIAVLLLVAGCQSAAPPLRVTCAEPSWQPSIAPDSTVGLCMPPGFSRKPDRPLWARGGVTDTDYAWLSVAVLDSSAAATEWGTPPQPRSFRRSDPATVLHAIQAESVVVHQERIAAAPVEVETGRISGGQVGFRRQPALRAVWPLSGGRWAFAQGYAERAQDLDTLRAMLRTASIAP